jgi:thioredoxin-like negative regulator of GroEL
VYIEQGNFNEAAPILKHLEGLDPRPNGVLLNLAITSLGNNDPEAALSYLDQAEETADTSFWQIQFHRALALARLNRLSEALSLYKKVESKRPGDYRVQFNLALTYDALEDYPQALDYYEKMLKADQTSEKDRSSIVRRVELLRRYLYTNQSQAKRQHDGKTHR